MKDNFNYFAFISYKREDERWAKWLQHKLELYRLPNVIRQNHPDFPKRIKIFRDKDYINSGPLYKILHEELEASKYLIVICSPRSAQSEWAGKEISDFIDMGRQAQIILFIIDGMPYSGDSTECIHQVIKEKLPEMLGININEEGRESQYIKKEKAFIRVITKMLEVDFDVLWNKHKRRLIRNAITGILCTLLFLTCIGFTWEINQPINMAVNLKEITPTNMNLPYEQGKVILVLSKDTLVKSVNRLSDPIIFRNIPGKYLNKEVSLSFSMRGYTQIDTLLPLKRNTQLNIARDMTWGILGGIVTDDNLVPIEDVVVEMQNGLTATTNKDGKFEIHIPIDQQLQYGDASFSKSGYVTKTFKNTIIGKNWEIILTKRKT